jgi:hypothetical protein
MSAADARITDTFCDAFAQEGAPISERCLGSSIGLTINSSSQESSELSAKRLRSCSSPTSATSFSPSNINTMSDAYSTKSATTTRKVPIQPSGSVPEYGNTAEGSVSSIINIK